MQKVTTATVTQSRKNTVGGIMASDLQFSTVLQWQRQLPTGTKLDIRPINLERNEIRSISLILSKKNQNRARTGPGGTH